MVPWLSHCTAMAEPELPEEIIFRILSFLPVKSLIRFTCVSKRFHFIILFDPKFANTQFQAARDRKTLHHRLLLCTNPARQLESLDLDTPSFGEPSSVRNLQFPFTPPDLYVSLLGSVNGIVFVAFGPTWFCTWNPSTRFFKKLPDLVCSTSEESEVTKLLVFVAYGVGYLSATDDYRVFVDVHDDFEAAVFSSRAHAWKKVGVKDGFEFDFEGSLVNEALHWLIDNDGDEIVAFDLAQEEDHKFRKMLLPRNFHDIQGDSYCNSLGVSAGGLLILVRIIQRDVSDRVEVWVMREYDVCDSWSKLFNLKVPDSLVVMMREYDVYDFRVIVLETGMVARIRFGLEYKYVMILEKEEDKCSVYNVGSGRLVMTQYQESLLQIDD